MTHNMELDPTRNCPVCGLHYVPQGFRCRVSTYRKDGTRREECMTCGVEREKAEALSTIPNRDTN